MRGWLVSCGLAVAAFALFYTLLVAPTIRSAPETLRYPLSAEPAAPGYLGLMRWLAAEHVPTLAWRSRFERLGAPNALPSATGNLLITTMPHSRSLRRDEFESLNTWIARGNTLFVVAALDDTPQWSATAGPEFLAELGRMTRFKVEAIKDEHAPVVPDTRALVDKLLEPARVTIEPIPTGAAPHWLLSGVRSLQSISDLPASRWRVTPLDMSPALELARRADTGDAALWQARVGRGSLLLSAFASPFSNAGIGTADNARLLANLVAHSVGPDGRVVLDDSHQNAVDFYDPKAFAADPRLHRAIFWIVLTWFLFVVGARALPRAATPRAPIDDAAMLRLTARFYASAISVPAAAERLLAHFFNAIRHRIGLRENGEPTWDWLGAQARVPPSEIESLRNLHERAAANRSVSLPRLRSLLATVSGRLE